MIMQVFARFYLTFWGFYVILSNLIKVFDGIKQVVKEHKRNLRNCKDKNSFPAGRLI